MNNRILHQCDTLNEIHFADVLNEKGVAHLTFSGGPWRMGSLFSLVLPKVSSF